MSLVFVKMGEYDIRLASSGAQSGEDDGANYDNSNNHVMPPGRGLYFLCVLNCLPWSCHAELRVPSSLT